MWHLLTKPAVWALGGFAASYLLHKRSASKSEQLRDAKIEIVEQRNTIRRLRAELGRIRHEDS